MRGLDDDGDVVRSGLVIRRELLMDDPLGSTVDMDLEGPAEDGGAPIYSSPLFPPATIRPDLKKR